MIIKDSQNTAQTHNRYKSKYSYRVPRGLLPRVDAPLQSQAVDDPQRSANGSLVVGDQNSVRSANRYLQKYNDKTRARRPGGGFDLLLTTKACKKLNKE
mmetsp:Transcript_4930/g.8553  ORF Transcript_4930/g.8553 Transcript_4930/m.8553 type:complete len:99 (+) Transcript_4930:315-611(+)